LLRLFPKLSPDGIGESTLLSRRGTPAQKSGRGARVEGASMAEHGDEDRGRIRPGTAPLDEVLPSVASNPVTTAPPRTPGHVGARFVITYGAAYTAMWMALLAPVVVTLALRVEDMVGTDDGPATLSLVLGVGALIALLGNPVFGRLSDRTTSRLGMRRPWMVGGAVVGALALVVVALAPNIPVLLVGWCLAQLGYNALLAALSAVLPDQVPAEQRGTVAGVLGVSLPLGLILGTFVVQLVAGNLLLMFLLPALVALVGVGVLAAALDDRRLSRADRPPYGLASFLRSFWVNPRRQPDFAWAWLSRFLLFIGLASLITYSAFFLLDRLGVPEDDLPGMVFLATLVQSVTVVLSSLVAGRLSDRTGRRKVFVLAAALVYGLGLGIIAVSGTFGLFLVGMVVTGVGQGAYLAVDLALVTDVLPDREVDAGKDLGVLNIANALPQVVAPAIAPLFLAIGGPNNYTALFVAAALFAAAGAAAITPVRGVR
jgi:MFS family permease